MRERKLWLDACRVMLTALVVVGHGAYYGIQTAFGGIHYDALMAAAGVADTGIHAGLSALAGWIYSFHMPVFIALSGVQFSEELAQGRYPTFLSLVRARAKRLMVPCIAVWFLWNLPVKALTGYYEGHTALEALAQFIFSKNVYLWFLQALFFDFLICYGVARATANELLQLAAMASICGLGLLLERRMGDYVPLGNPFKYALWLWIGMRTAVIVKRLKRLHLWRALPVCALLAAQIILFRFQRLGWIPHGGLLGITVYPLMMYMVLLYLSEGAASRISAHGAEARLISAGDRCFGVYLYADPLNYGILYLTYLRFGIQGFGSPGVSAAVITLRLLLTPALAVLLTEMLEHNRRRIISRRNHAP